MELPTVSEEKLLIVVLFLLAVGDYLFPEGQHSIVNTIAGGLLGYLTKGIVGHLSKPPQ